MLIDVNKHTIREFTMKDKEIVTEFFDQMGGESRSFFNRANGSRASALSYFEKNGEEPEIKRFLSSIIDENGKEIMTGYILAWDMNIKVPMLGIVVREEYKGHGLGGLLITHLKNYLESNGYGGVMLTVSFANMRGQALYARMGFRHIGTHPMGELLFLLPFNK